ncbi:MAG: MBL fold metallo-hydrolase RNA specificity domain-containing protein [Persicimonas sp.]
MNELSFCALSGAGEVSGNAFLLEAGGVRLLLDAGAAHNREPAWVDRLERPDACWVSHVHWDHFGAVVPIIERFPRARFLVTSTTGRLAAVALEQDGMDSDRAGALASRLEAVPTRRYFDISSESDSVGAEKFRANKLQAMAFPAGHIPGAAMLLVEADVGGDRPFRLLYTGDFCGHDQPLVDGALFPRTGQSFPIDVLVIEGVLATQKKLDKLDYAAELSRLIGTVSERKGGALVGVSTLAEAAPLARALSDAGESVVVHRALESVLAVCWPEYRDGGVELADDSQCARALQAGRVVLAPGEQFAPSSAAGRALESVVGRKDALVVVVNRAHKKSVAGRLLSAQPGQKVRLGRRKVPLEATVEHFSLPNHAPRSQLVEAVQAVDPGRVLLVHGHKSHLYALKRAIEKSGFSGEIDVPENGTSIVLGE